jgi:hypothetical protein
MDDYVFLKESTGDEVIVISEEGHFQDHLPLDEAMEKYGRDVPLADLDVRVESYRVESAEYAAYKIGLHHGRDLGASAFGDTTYEGAWERSRDYLLDHRENDLYPGNPLSGEWADSYTQANLCRDVEHDWCDGGEGCTELADAYEDGHFHGWHEKVAHAVAEHFRDEFPSNEEIERAAHNG